MSFSHFLKSFSNFGTLIHAGLLGLLAKKLMVLLGLIVRFICLRQDGEEKKLKVTI